LNHSVLLDILSENIHDNSLLRLIKHLLQAGYLEDWRYYATYSGSPQGGVVSPILSNIYLNKLDQYIAKELLPVYTQGERPKASPAYHRIENQI
jgi:retron-type reverse transcriptase